MGFLNIWNLLNTANCPIYSIKSLGTENISYKKKQKPKKSLHFQKPSLMFLASMGALQFSAPTSGRHLSTCLEHFCFHLSFLSMWLILPGLLLQGENDVSFRAYPCIQPSAWHRVHTEAVSRGNGWRTGSATRLTAPDWARGDTQVCWAP